jgi:hypothetical protein
MALALILPWPRRVALAFRYDFPVVFCAVMLIFLIVFLVPTKWRWAAGLCTSFFVFGIPLASLWVSGANEPNTVFGLLPWFDASGYYHEASRLSDGMPFTGISTRRPVYPAFFAALLSLTNQNLMTSLAVQAAINAFAAWLFAWEIKRHWGSISGALSLTLVFFFYRRFTGSVLTEMLGLPIALTGFSILLQTIKEMKSGRLFLASFLLSLALNVRAGAFFTLPMIVLWVLLLYCNKKEGGIGLRFGLASLSGVILGFLANLMIFYLLCQPGTQLFANFSFTFYGVATGGTGWLQVFNDHPEIYAIPENQQTGFIYSLAIEEIIINPGRFYSGFLSAIAAFFLPSASGMFGFIGQLYDWSNKPFEMIIRLILMFFSLLSLAATFTRRKQPVYSLMLLLFIGLLLSVPFAPPTDADHMRAYAATIPLIVCLPTSGLGLLLDRWRITETTRSEISFQQEGIFVITASTLLLLALIVPPFVYRTGSISEPSPVSCQAGLDSLRVRLNQGSMIHLLPDELLSKTHLPNLRLSNFENNLKDFPEWNMAADFINLTAPASIYVTANLVNGDEVWIIFEGNPPSLTGQIVTLCGRFDHDSRLKNLFRVQSEGT